MFDVNVSQEQLAYATHMVDRFNFGQCGYGDGNKKEQLTAIVGQTIFADLLGMDQPNGSKGFDGGYDFHINGKTVDIKTMSRSVPMRDYFVHNFIGYQRNYDVDFYVFASSNTKINILTICGCVDKKTFLIKQTTLKKDQ